MGFEHLAKSEQSARQSYVTDLRRAVSCIADVVLETRLINKTENSWLIDWSLRTNKDLKGTGSMDEEADFIMLRCNDDSKLYLELTQHIKVLRVQTEKDEFFRISTLKYIYAVYRTPDDALVAWHFHPESFFKFPHLHVYDRKDEQQRKAGCKPFMLHDMHIPSGRVALEDVIRFVITEMNVKPDKKRAEDWEKVLAETKATFEASKSWGTSSPQG